MKHPALPVSLERVSDASPTPLAISGWILPRTALGFSTTTGCWGSVGTLVIAYPSFMCLVSVS